MNILFISIGDVATLKMDEHGVYTDLVRELHKRGNEVYVVCSREKRYNQKTILTDEAGIHVLRVQTGNITKTNLIEKGISIISIDGVFKKAIKKYFSGIAFDLVLYSTPPITLTGILAWVKKSYGAKSYLMLKDIFPQNAVDLGMMKTTGITSLIYRYFRRKEKKLYALSDRIGCMSPANVEYVLEHNPEIAVERVGLCPNSMDCIDVSVSAIEREELRIKYDIPLDKKVFVYGGNLGKPQGVPFIIDCLRACKPIDDAFFLIVGSGTDYGLLEEYVKTEKPKNVRLLPSLPKDEYDHMLAACDVGLIFLDHRFTIPNFPSRLLSYMQAGLPVLACTDTATDIGKVITEGGFGWWCESNDAMKFVDKIIVIQDVGYRSDYISNAYKYLKQSLSVNISCQDIMERKN